MQHLGLLATVLITAGLIFTITKWRGGMHMTFSQHAAQTSNAQIYYSSLFILTLPLLWIFLVFWLVPEKNLPAAFVWLASIGNLFQILCTFFPEVGGTKTVIHRILTGISGVTLMPMMYILATATAVSDGLQGFLRIAGLIMVVLLGIALAKQKGFRYALLLQVGYYFLFLLSVLLVAYF